MQENCTLTSVHEILNNSFVYLQLLVAMVLPTDTGDLLLGYLLIKYIKIS